MIGTLLSHVLMVHCCAVQSGTSSRWLFAVHLQQRVSEIWLLTVPLNNMVTTLFPNGILHRAWLVCNGVRLRASELQVGKLHQLGVLWSG